MLLDSKLMHFSFSHTGRALQPILNLFDGALDVWLLVGAVTEGSVGGLFAVAEPVVSRLLHLEQNGPGKHRGITSSHSSGSSTYVHTSA